MNINGKLKGLISERKMLFTLWVFVMFNYLYCDVMSVMDPQQMKEIATGQVGGIQMTPEFLLGAAILMEIPIGMVLLSRILPNRANRWTNIIAGTIMTLVQLASLFAGSSPTVYYIFFSVIEISCTAFITVYAWKWKEETV